MSENNLVYRFSFPTDIRFGLNAIDQLAKELSARHLKNPLIVTDTFLGESKLCQNILHALETNSIKARLFAGVKGNPIESQVNAGVDTCKKFNCDAIIALGGGASIDVAKAIALLEKNGGCINDYDDLNPQKKISKSDLLFLIAIPTTAGTGSEVGRSTVISDDQSKQKKIICDPALLPKLVIADPKLTTSLPAHLTAATGMDALTHHVEAFLVNDFHPMCDGIALEGLSLIGESLVKAFIAAKNNDESYDALNHRSNMLASSLMGAVAFQKGLGATHSLAHALSTVCDLHHGLANALVLPHVLQFNFLGCEKKYKRMQNALSCQKELSSYVSDLLEQMEIKKSLSDHGVKKSDLEKISHVAFLDGCHQTNPKSVTQKDFTTLLEKAF